MNLLERRIDTVDPRLSVKLRGLKLQLRRDRMRDVVRRCVRPGQTVVDIGANRGVYTWMMSRRVGPDGHVHSIEPYPGNIERLNTLSACRTNITVHPVALSDHDGAATLQVPQHHKVAIDALANLRTTTAAASVSLQVETRTLDGVLRCDEQPVGFMKCDVEGHEDEVIRGGWHTITTHRPVMVIEIEQRHRTTPVMDLIQRLLEVGYNCVFLDEDGSHPIREFDIDRHQLDHLTEEFVPHAMPRGYVNNFLFLPTAV